jgi:hypothetical protein
MEMDGSGETADYEYYQSLEGRQGEVAGDPGDHLGYAVVIADFDQDGFGDIAAGRSASCRARTTRSRFRLCSRA